MIIIHTDGSNVFNGKPWSYGGYGYVIEYAGAELDGGGSMEPNLDEPVTNNRAELLAIIRSLEVLATIGVKNETIKVVSDSQLCVECANGNWRRKKNNDLWNEYSKVKHKLRLARNELSIEWIKGHAGHEMNERADVLAGSYRDDAKPSPQRLEELKGMIHHNTL